MDAETTTATPLACTLAALTADERARRQALTDQLAAAREEVRDEEDGYTFRYQAALLPVAAAFVALERRCCPFFRFTLTLDPADGPLWLRITGGEGAKDMARVALNQDA